MILVDQAVEFTGQGNFVEVDLGDIEIESALAIADLAAGHRPIDQGTEKMEAGVNPHQAMPPIPVDFAGD